MSDLISRLAEINARGDAQLAQVKLTETQFIVAEISKNWLNGRSPTPLLAQQFEYAIEYNRQRGYRLHSFQLHQLLLSRADHAHPDNEMVETIIAVFERIELQPSVDAVDPSAAEIREIRGDPGDPGTPTPRDKGIS